MGLIIKKRFTIVKNIAFINKKYTTDYIVMTCNIIHEDKSINSLNLNRKCGCVCGNRLSLYFSLDDLKVSAV